MKNTFTAIAALSLAASLAPTLAAPGLVVNGGSPQSKAVAGSVSGNDVVSASGAFSGSYTQNPANAGGPQTATITLDSTANVTVPSGIFNRTQTQTRSVGGTNYTDTYTYNALFAFNHGSLNNSPVTLNNQGIINATFTGRPPSTQVYGLDKYIDGVGVPNPAANETYVNVDGVLGWCTNVTNNNQNYPTSIVNGSSTNSSATIKAILTGTGQGFANGIQSMETYGPNAFTSMTVQNYGTIDGEVKNNDGTATGINSYSNYTGLSITNYEGATCSASAPYYASGIYGQIYNGDITAVNDGTAQATATGGKQGNTANQAYASGVDLFNYAGSLTFTNDGTATGTTSGTPNGSGGTNVAYGVFLWNQNAPAAGGMTFTNSGTVTATSSTDPNAAAKAVYCGGNGGTQTINNYGSITGTGGPQGGWALGVENDQNDPVNITNTGVISHNNGLGIALFQSTGQAIIRNLPLASIYGGLIGIASETYPGPVTIYNHGSLKCSSGSGGASAMDLGAGNNAVYFYGLPAVTGSLNGGPQPTGGGSSTKTLSFHLTGVLQTVLNSSGQSQPITGGNLSSYGLTTGSIVVGGQTYGWNGFNISGFTAAPSFANGTYKIINRYSGKALGARGSGTANGTIVEQYTYGGGTPQQWAVTSLGNGRYKILNVNAGRVLEVNSAATDDGATIDIYDYVSGATNEEWILVPTDSGYYTLTPANALGSCMDITGVSQNNSIAMDLWEFRDADAPNSDYNQQWILQAP